MSIFKNQYNFRVSNQLEVINALRKGPLSLLELSEQIGVSFTAIDKIVEQLTKAKIVSKVSKKSSSESKRGRTPTFVQINTNNDVVAAIELASRQISVTVLDVQGKIVAREYLPRNGQIKISTFQKISEILKKLLVLPAVGNRKLKGICISSQGLVNKSSGELAISSSISVDNTFSPLNFFFNEFGVHTALYNDVKLAMVAERIYGCVPDDAKDYLYAHIGHGCALSFSFGGKLYQGARGYTGELTNYNHISDYSNRCDKNYLYCIGYIADEAQKINPNLKLMDENHNADSEAIIKAYQENDPAVVKAVEIITEKNAAQLIAYSDLLDFDYIILEGDMNLLGPSYKELLIKDINELDQVSFKPKILFSTLSEVDRPSTLGAMYQATNIYFLNKLQKLTNERCVSGNYDISDTFGTNI